MRRILLIGFAACTIALAPTLPASAVPGHPSALSRTDNSIIPSKWWPKLLLWVVPRKSLLRLSA